MNAPEESSNGNPAESLDAYDGMSIRLSDDTIDKLVDKITEKLCRDSMR